MRFQSVFIAVGLGTALIVASLILHGQRPASDTDHPSADLVKASGKCASCHRQETPGVVHQYERSQHAKAGVNCLQCHQPQGNQDTVQHNGFEISADVTSLNCKQCHTTEYNQFLRSRHAAPAWAAVDGPEGFTTEQIAFAEKHHPGTVNRPPNKLVLLEGPGAKAKGCYGCHDVGRPNPDGSIGSCTHCHSRHNASVELARLPNTCGQCHMGPDHSQLEIYTESKHGALFNAQRHTMNLKADPKKLTTADMSVPTCATCHMSGIEGNKVTHDTTSRLSQFLYAPVTKKRPHYEAGKIEMQETCTKCHVKANVERFYAEAEVVVEATNAKVNKAKALMDELRAEGLLTKDPFDEPIEFLYFDYWHYYGRTAKHGAYMGGADFVQWHGNYELLKLLREMEHMAEELRAKKKKAE